MPRLFNALIPVFDAFWTYAPKKKWTDEDMQGALKRQMNNLATRRITDVVDIMLEQGYTKASILTALGSVMLNLRGSNNGTGK